MSQAHHNAFHLRDSSHPHHPCRPNSQHSQEGPDDKPEAPSERHSEDFTRENTEELQLGPVAEPLLDKLAPEKKLKRKKAVEDLRTDASVTGNVEKLFSSLISKYGVEVHAERTDLAVIKDLALYIDRDVPAEP
ncbi:hypothetical protein SLS60_005428 [Paraconiothyrium brasiliense]|uniref:Uncharacterized protein n=1 Tax=Paraconiothyrium brasiliense TaxID=300254 RepID=A0ABR3RIW0_9PLEO